MSSPAPAPTRADIVRLPKAQLHLHLESAMRVETAAELADRYQRPAPRSDQNYPHPGSYVRAYELARGLIRTLDDLARVAREIAEDAARHGVVWTEVHLVPLNYYGRLGATEAVIEAAADGLRAGSAASGTGAALIVAHNRTRPAEDAWRALRAAGRFAGSDVVGYGLVGEEPGYPPEPFAEVFMAAADVGLRSVPHAGEGAGPDSICRALVGLTAARIAHGVRAVENPALVARLAASNVCLDIAPTSNVRLGVYPNLAAHPLRTLVRAGVPVSLSSDGPVFLGVDIVDEYLAAHDTIGLEVYELAQVARDSLTHSCAPAEIKRPALDALDEWSLA